MVLYIEKLNDDHFEVGDLNIIKGANKKVFDGLNAALDHIRERFTPIPSKGNRLDKHVTCKKKPHIGDGYLHGEDDDSPYDVDGHLYCGRCHTAI